MSNQPIDSTFRTAYQALLDEAPQAPDWDQLAVPVYRPIRKQPRRLPRWAGALVVASVVLVTVGGAAWLFATSGDPNPNAESAPRVTAAVEVRPPSIVPSTALGSKTPVTIVDGFRIQFQFVPRTVTASSSLVEFEPRNLLDGDLGTAWNDDSHQGEGAQLTFTFAEPILLERIVLSNLADESQFKRNFRVAEYAIETGVGSFIVGGLLDTQDGQEIIIESPVEALTFIVTDVYAAESFNGQPPFLELAIADMTFFGYEIEPAPIAGSMDARLHELEASAIEVTSNADDLLINDIVAVSRVRYLASGFGDGEPAIFTSEDGIDWSRHQVPGRDGESIGGLASFGDVVIATTGQPAGFESGDAGIWRSEGGVSWQRITTLNGWIGQPVESSDGRLVAPTWRWSGTPGLLISSNRGQAWVEHTFEGDRADDQARVTGLAHISGRTIAVGRDGSGRPIVWHAGDPTGPWNRVTNEPDLGVFAEIHAVGATENKFLVAGTGGGAWVGASHDGLSWTVQPLPQPGTVMSAETIEVQSMTITDSLVVLHGRVFLANQTRGLVWMSEDGLRWSVVDLGPDAIDLRGVAISEDRVVVIARHADDTLIAYTAER